MPIDEIIEELKKKFCKTEYGGGVHPNYPVRLYLPELEGKELCDLMDYLRKALEEYGRERESKALDNEMLKCALANKLRDAKIEAYEHCKEIFWSGDKTYKQGKGVDEVDKKLKELRGDL